MDIRTKRIYDDPSPDDGRRVLVDRLWPRGISRERARLDDWAKDAAPSDELRRRYHGDGGAWEEFCERYAAELDAQPGAVAELTGHAAAGRLTLLYASKDPERNNAVALADYLRRRAGG